MAFVEGAPAPPPKGNGVFRTKPVQRDWGDRGTFDIFVCDNCGQENWTSRRDIMLTMRFVREDGDDLSHDCESAFVWGLIMQGVMDSIPPGLAEREMKFDHR